MEPSLVEIRIETNDRGPWAEDVEWVFVMSDGEEHRFPNDENILHKCQELPGFDNQKVIEAMMCTENQTFVVWKTPS